MPADEARTEPMPPHSRRDRCFHAHHVGQRAVRGERGDSRQDLIDRGHRHRDHDQRIGLGRPAQHRGQVAGDVEAVRAGRLATGLRPVVPPRPESGADRRAQQRSADQSGPEDADGGLLITSHRNRFAYDFNI